MFHEYEIDIYCFFFEKGAGFDLEKILAFVRILEW